MHLAALDVPIQQVELAPDLEWMLQSNQVDDDCLCQTLLREQYALLLALAGCLCPAPAAAEKLALAALGRVLACRHEYWAGSSLRAWLAQQVYRTANEQPLAGESTLRPWFPLALARLGWQPGEIATALELAPELVAKRLESAGGLAVPATLAQLDAAAARLVQPAPSGEDARRLTALALAAACRRRQGVSRKFHLLEALLGLFLLLAIGGYSLWRTPLDVAARHKTVKIIYYVEVTATLAPTEMLTATAASPLPQTAGSVPVHTPTSQAAALSPAQPDAMMAQGP